MVESKILFEEVEKEDFKSCPKEIGLHHISKMVRRWVYLFWCENVMEKVWCTNPQVLEIFLKGFGPFFCFIT
jgi:hypothetical protein